MSRDLSTIKKITRKLNLVVWSILGFFLVGYLPAKANLRPQLAVTLTVALSALGVIPYASKIARPMKSALIAGLLGLVAGASLAATGGGLTYLFSTGGFCAGVGALFGHLARQRRRQAEEEWKKHG
jgi:hypothetical protein